MSLSLQFGQTVNKFIVFYQFLFLFIFFQVGIQRHEVMELCAQEQGQRDPQIKSALIFH